MAGCAVGWVFVDELESGLVAGIMGGLVAGLPLCLFGGNIRGRGGLAEGVCIDFGVVRIGDSSCA